MASMPPEGIGDFQVKESQVNASIGQKTGSIPSNPARVALLLGCTGGQVVLSLNAVPGAQNFGVPITTAQGVFQLKWSDYGALVTQPIYYFCPNGVVLTYWEVIYRPLQEHT